MKKSIVVKNGVSEQVVDLICRLVDMIPWPNRRSAMGDATVTLLDGKPRVAEDVFGWSRITVELGMNELRSKILCINDLSARKKPRVEEKNSKLLSDIVEIMTPHSNAEPSLRTTFSYTNLTAKSVYELLIDKGWPAEKLPAIRTISNILNRQDYRLRTVAKTKVQTRSSTTYGK
ncbi:MAG: hypothetical protein QG618_1174 [Thermodesulfobacteriota bacterium]|nr:hypothetical protein [Thermodesulfobacteriota bacterium]